VSSVFYDWNSDCVILIVEIKYNGCSLFSVRSTMINDKNKLYVYNNKT
jgi:hypothetical protein